jgi:hypothetical protein
MLKYEDCNLNQSGEVIEGREEGKEREEVERNEGEKQGRREEREREQGKERIDKEKKKKEIQRLLHGDREEKGEEKEEGEEREEKLNNRGEEGEKRMGGGEGEKKEEGEDARAMSLLLDVEWRLSGDRGEREGGEEGREEIEGEEGERGVGEDIENEDRGVFRLSSSILSARCPGLRPVIEKHLKEATHTVKNTRTPLVLFFTGSKATLTCVLTYVHSGIILLPLAGTGLSVCLEVIKIASEWGMESLISEVCHT